ncbi:MAG TPA: hypothetical protein VLS93_15745 [Anaeromyxobacteraceae bacterium]|nr:hypothetical protein [Anaeromyxobacteraceae bacterium]
MSKLKHPHQKKLKSLERDRRAVRPEGERGKRAGPEEKVRLERHYRHEVRQALHLESTKIDEDDALALDAEALRVPRERIEKPAPLPLADAIAVKQRRRARRVGRHKARRGVKA